MKKYRQIKINLYESDYNTLLINIKNDKSKSVSDYVRNKLNFKIENSRLNSKIITESVSKVDIRLIYEINKIGTNLNQIAKYVNTHKYIDRAVLTELVEIEYSLKDLI